MPKENRLKVGTCNAYIPSWYHNSYRGRCIKFIFAGCGGNANRFKSEQDCKNFCVYKNVTRKAY